MIEPRHLFVYGTLRRGSAHPMARLLAARASFAGTATVRGQLHDLGAYPGMILRDGGDQVVEGELFELHPGARDALLDMLDRYEGADASTRPPLFRRESTTVVRNDGTLVDAWIYTYAGTLSSPSDG